MGKYDAVPYVIEIKRRMKLLGISLDAFLEEDAITNHWPQPRGFNFVAGFSKTQNLELALLMSKHFGIDHPLSKRIRGSRAYREVSRTDGIHITLAPGKPFDEYPKSVKWHFNIHIDSVSMCPAVNHLPGRDTQLCSLGSPKDDAYQNLVRIIKHIKTDLLHK